MDISVTSSSREQTAKLGALLGEILTPGDVLCLDGELGAGKTVLVQALALERGRQGPVPSPTFTIINPYPEIGLCHIDAFRLSGPVELIEAGVEEYLDGSWICAVEWAARVQGALPPDTLGVSIDFGEKEDDRLVRVRSAGRWNGRAEALRAGIERNV